MKKILSVFICFLLLLSSCGKQKDKKADYLGEYTQDYAPVVVLELFDTEEGTMLEYREVLNLEKFVANTTLPIVLCVRQQDDYAAPIVIPRMETWAVDYRDRAYFLFADANAETEFLQLFDFHVTPTLYLIHKGSQIAYASWQEENALDILEASLDKIVVEES